jgi:hypothetical protein
LSADAAEAAAACADVDLAAALDGDRFAGNELNRAAARTARSVASGRACDERIALLTAGCDI